MQNKFYSTQSEMKNTVIFYKDLGMGLKNIIMSSILI